MKKIISLLVLISFIFWGYFLYQKNVVYKELTTIINIINSSSKNAEESANNCRKIMNFDILLLHKSDIDISKIEEYRYMCQVNMEAYNYGRLKAISENLSLTQINKEIDIPINKINININNALVWYQWYIWDEILKDIFLDNYKDIITQESFIYYLTSDKKYFQLMWYKWKDKDINMDYSFLNYIYSIFTFDIRSELKMINLDVIILWKKILIITDKNNLPIQNILKEESFDYKNLLEGYRVYFKDDEFLSWKIENIDLFKQSLEEWWKWFFSNWLKIDTQ